MIRQLVFDDEIVLWWEKDEFDKKADSYTFYINGEKSGETRKTHCAFRKLDGDTEYSITIIAYKDNVEAGKRELFIRTKKRKNKIDVTGAPYFAVGDGKTLNTEALQKALTDCTENDCVYFPSGNYLTGALNVFSDTEIYFEEGAVLLGSVSDEDYLPKIRSRFEGTERMCYRSLLNIGRLDRDAKYTVENVVVRGKGKIYGGGAELCNTIIEKETERLKDYLAENAEYVKTCENEQTIPGRARGRLINVSNGNNIVISGLTIENPPAWSVHAIYSNDVTVYDCKLVSKNVFNGDGFDPDSSENCAVFATVFETSDDCVAIKSGKNPEGNIINRPCRNIYIFDCRNLTKKGISVGSEMSGGVENVYVWDCDFGDSFGFIIKGTEKRGGYVRNVNIYDCTLSCFLVFSVLYNDDGESAPNPPKFSDFLLEGCTLLGHDIGFIGNKGHKYVMLYGFSKKGYEIENVVLRDCILVTHDENDCYEICENAQSVMRENVKILSENGVNR